MRKFDVFESWLLLVEGQAQRFDCSLITGTGYLGKCLCPDQILFRQFLAVIEVSNIKVTKRRKKSSAKEIKYNLSTNYL